MNNIYHCLVFEQNDFLENQVIEELLRERANYYIEKNQLNDFWILINPDFLKGKEENIKIKNTSYFKNLKNKGNFYCVLISTNIEFIKWIKLRIGYFENINEPLSNKNSKSDGIYFELNQSKLILKDNYIALCPEILVKQLQYGSVN